MINPSTRPDRVSFIVLAIALVFVGLASAGAQVGTGPVDWNRYYSNGESVAIMQRYAREYPDLTRVYSIGKSYLGVDLMVMEVTNRRIGLAEEKPALYVDGNIHSGELTSGAFTLYFMAQLLDRYAKEPAIKELVDSTVFYLRPKFNPDGSDFVLRTGLSVRSTLRPVDNDHDGKMDEDPAEDLNGDGFITRMRIPDPKGNRKISPEDSRIMTRRAQGDSTGPFYRVIGEGIDNDGDGRINEDGIGGLDMNRNFPRNWALQYKQSGAGAFPLSEPETYATVKFIDAHPNITGIVHNHTSGGFIYRLPSACDPASFPPNDIELIKLLGARYTETTGRSVNPSSRHATRHRYGTLISWAYWDRGIIGWVPEFWPGLAKTEIESLKIDDEKLGGRYFVEWTPFDHPQFGKVEIGGWRSVFSRQNPPPELLEEECKHLVPWTLYLARQAPRLAMSEPSAHQLGGGRIEIRATVRNLGFLPTNLTDRGIEAEVVAPVIASLRLKGASLVEDVARKSLGHLSGRHQVPGSENKDAVDVSWIVKVDSGRASFRIVAKSQKGGVVRSERIDLP